MKGHRTTNVFTRSYTRKFPLKDTEHIIHEKKLKVDMWPRKKMILSFLKLVKVARFEKQFFRSRTLDHFLFIDNFVDRVQSCTRLFFFGINLIKLF